MINLRDMARAALGAGADLVGMHRRGELRREHLWVAAGGAKAYLAALASGEEARSQPEQEAFLGVCEVCPSRRGADGAEPRAGVPVQLTYCGAPFEDHLDSVLPTCGCLLGGAAALKGKACPQGKR